MRYLALCFVFGAVLALAGCSTAPAPAALAPTTASPTIVVPTAAPSATVAPTATPAPSPTPQPDGTLQQVLKRGELRCGVDGAIPGLAAQGAEEQWVGLGVDYCRAVAAAVLGDPQAVSFRLLDEQTLVALRSGAVDVVALTAVLTDAEQGDVLHYGPPLFYDSLAALAPAALELTSTRALSGTVLCVERDAAAEQALAEAFFAQGQRLSTRVFAERSDLLDAYGAERCDGVAGRASQLLADSTALTDFAPQAIALLEAPPQPWAAVALARDTAWTAVLDRVTHDLLEAEALHVTAEATQGEQAGGNQQAEALLDRSGVVARRLGLHEGFSLRAIGAVGNYGEMYNRALDSDALQLPRGPNRLVTDGGLLGPTN